MSELEQDIKTALVDLRIFNPALVRGIVEGKDARIAALKEEKRELLKAMQRLLAAYRVAVKLHDPNTDDAYTVDAHIAIAKAVQS